jgi:hypothetical protein
MTNPRRTRAALALAVIGLVGPEFAASQQAPLPGQGTYWHYDAETALEVARKTGRPMLVLKIRADIGEKPTT